MRKGVKMLAVGGMLTAGILASNVNAISDLNYTVNVYKKYEVLTDEGTMNIPTSYHFDNGTKDGMNLDLTSLANNLKNISEKNPSVLTYDANTRQVSAKHGVYLTYTGAFDMILLNNNGTLEEDLDSASVKDTLVRIAEVNMLTKSKEQDIANFQSKLPTATTDYEKNKLNTQIQNYTEDLARMRKLNLNDIPTDKTGYSFVTTAKCVAGTSYRYNSQTGAHIGDNVKLSYYYYTILIKDLRLNSIKYKINGGEEKAVVNFDKDTKTYTVQLPLGTPANATITTSSDSYAQAVDKENDWVYDDGITVQEANVTLNNGTGTGKVKVKFDATSYGNNGTYEKEYTLNFVTLAYQKGDVNKDGFVNAADAAYILDRFKNSDAKLDDYDLGDMNNDNILNSTDAAMILDIFKNR